MLAGGLFALTAKTYAEGASMFPEAGGSSSFARHAFNELVSFFAGWALSLDYILTIAISAFFVPHYLGAFLPALTHPPGDVIGGLVVIAVLAWLNIRGIGESARLNFVLALMDLAMHDQGVLDSPVEKVMGPRLPTIGVGQPLELAVELLDRAPAVVVLAGGRPHIVLARTDVLRYLSGVDQ